MGEDLPEQQDRIVPGKCGACIAFVMEQTADDGSKGRCRLRPEMGVIPFDLPRCPKYIERGTGATWTPPRVAKSRRGRGHNSDTGKSTAPKIKRYGKYIDLGEDAMETDALRALFEDVLREEGLLGETAIGGRWEGGTLVLKPADSKHAPKEIPLNTFFHKIVMVRDKLRVLEQKINSHSGLSDQDKVDMQQYITRAYGSLTTFNILFRDRQDQFSTK